MNAVTGRASPCQAKKPMPPIDAATAWGRSADSPELIRRNRH